MSNIDTVTNNAGKHCSKTTGCWNCKYLDYFEAYYESGDSSGWCCKKREDVEYFRTFPCNRKLKCFEPKGAEE